MPTVIEVFNFCSKTKVTNFLHFKGSFRPRRGPCVNLSQRQSRHLSQWGRRLRLNLSQRQRDTLKPVGNSIDLSGYLLHHQVYLLYLQVYLLRLQVYLLRLQFYLLRFQVYLLCFQVYLLRLQVYLLSFQTYLFSLQVYLFRLQIFLKHLQMPFKGCFHIFSLFCNPFSPGFV